LQPESEESAENRGQSTGRQENGQASAAAAKEEPLAGESYETRERKDEAFHGREQRERRTFSKT